MQLQAAESPFRFDRFVLPIILGLGAFAGLIEAARAPEWAMQVQGWKFLTCMMGTGAWYLWMYDGRTPLDETRTYADGVVKAGVIASMFWGIAGMLVGVIIALQLSFPTVFYLASE